MSNKQVWAVMAVCVAAALFCAAYPLYVIRPFRAQGAEELRAALWVMGIRPAATLLCLGVTAVAAFRLWNRAPKRTARAAMAGGILAAGLSAVAARVNVFEMMFHPVAQPAFAPVGQSKLEADESVLAVHAGGVARAYPVRAIAYHHIVNDVVGDVALVATY